ncbi:MAG: cob(I)yrinic acid a,c-diamide adenosyltransferase [Nevskiales bacterium]
MKIYTRGGDGGSTQLLSVGRVAKDHPRLAAYGEIDELNSLLGVARAVGLAAPLPEWLLALQQQLFVLGSEIAVPKPEAINMSIPRVIAEQVTALEKQIDELDTKLPRLKNFILPGGTPGAAQLHLARCVCRRAERSLQSLHQAESLRAEVLAYINRLSDLLFTMARYENAQRGVEDVIWRS